MRKPDTFPPRIVLYEGPGSKPLADGERFRMLKVLLEAGYAVTRSANGSIPTTTDSSAVVLLGDFVECTCRLRAKGDATGQQYFINTSELDPEGVVSSVDVIRKQLGESDPGAWTPWFPVIDYDRCENCKQCLSFCLFGVYALSVNGQVEVRNPERCKTNCPACARVCPNIAIVFPKCDVRPVNGDEVREEDAKSEAVKVDISAILRQDIQSLLRARNREAGGRFPTARKESDEDPARYERLRQVQAALGIPDEVVSSSSCGCVGDEEAEGGPGEFAAPAGCCGGEEAREPPPARQEWDV